MRRRRERGPRAGRLRRRLLDQRIVIADPNRLTRMPADQVGEIWVSGPSVAQGYWNRADETEQTFRAYLQDTGEGPFLRTGDLGFMHDGELFITGRLKDLIIIRGANHYPQDIEADGGTEPPAACGRLRRGVHRRSEGAERAGDRARGRAAPASGRRRQVIEAIRRDVAAEHELLVDAIVLVKAGSIPKTSSGKIQRHACREGFWTAAGSRGRVASSWERRAAASAAAAERRGGTGRASRGRRRRDAAADAGSVERATPAAAPLEATTEIVHRHVRRVGQGAGGRAHARTSIVELGLDSLERMEIIAALERPSAAASRRGARRDRNLPRGGRRGRDAPR